MKTSSLSSSLEEDVVGEEGCCRHSSMGGTSSSCINTVGKRDFALGFFLVHGFWLFVIDNWFNGTSCLVYGST